MLIRYETRVELGKFVSDKVVNVLGRTEILQDDRLVYLSY